MEQQVNDILFSFLVVLHLEYIDLKGLFVLVHVAQYHSLCLVKYWV